MSAECEKCGLDLLYGEDGEMICAVCSLQAEFAALRAGLAAVTRERDELRALVEAFVAVEGSGPPKRWPAAQALSDWLAGHPEEVI